MMAVIESGGKQLRVEQGQTVQVESLPAAAGESVVFDRVLLVGSGEAVRVGSPTVEGATVKGTVLGHGRAGKVLVYVSKRRKNSNRKSRGHRQGYTAVRIDAIEG